MVRVAAAAALVAMGCVYTDPINQKPVIDSMQVQQAPTRYKAPVTVTFDAYDPDGDDFVVNASVSGAAAVTAYYQLSFTPDAPGTYDVVISATDSWGADSGEHHILVDVPNMKPQVGKVELTADAASVNTNLYPLGTTFAVVRPSIVDEDDLSTAMLTYVLTKPAGSQATVDQATGKFRVDVAGDYDVEVQVTDSRMATGSNHAAVSVAIDRWPCVAGTSPDASTPHLLTAIGETRRLLVTQVDDDLNPWPARVAGEVAHFQWLIGPGDGTFRVIPNWTQAYYDLDGSGYTVGEQVQVRVIVTDADSTHVPSCDPMIGSCPTPMGCPDWVTWNLEFYQ
jgi:hypothetical protein